MKSLLTLALALTTFVGCNEFVPADYTETVETGGKIEATYLKMDGHPSGEHLRGGDRLVCCVLS